MCLIVQVKTMKEATQLFNNPLVMKKDKIVYKVLEEKVAGPWGKTKHYVSPYRLYKWEQGWHYYERGGKLGVNGFGARCGGKWGFDVDQGLHAYSTPKSAHKHISAYAPSEFRVVEMVIPAGAKYYSSGGEIVATQMIFFDDAIILSCEEFAQKHNLKIK